MSMREILAVAAKATGHELTDEELDIAMKAFEELSLAAAKEFAKPEYRADRMDDECQSFPQK